ncbi:hypothetical protein LUQ84_001394 [Hamiltosporidium tvaerminnensis]|nr:hypothetical protein LUQ84_001394 [Hamiltosporidium tvaerminnensis]
MIATGVPYTKREHSAAKTHKQDQYATVSGGDNEQKRPESGCRGTRTEVKRIAYTNSSEQKFRVQQEQKEITKDSEGHK